MSLAAFRVTDMLMRRHTGMRAATISVEKVFFQEPRALLRLKAATPSPVNLGRGDGGPGGVRDRGAYGRDDPVNWEILIIPHQFRLYGGPVTNLQRERAGWPARCPAKNKAPAMG